METIQNQQLPEQPQAQQEEKGMNPFWKGVITTVALGTTAYFGYRYRHEIMRGGKKLGKKVTGLFSGKKKEEELSMIIIETPPRDERRREHRPQQQFPNNHQPNNGQWNKGNNLNQTNVKR